MFACVVVCHLKVHLEEQDPREETVNRKANKSHAETKDGHVTQILKKLTFPHVVARVKNYRWEEKVEKYFVTEFELLYMALTESKPE